MVGIVYDRLAVDSGHGLIFLCFGPKAHILEGREQLVTFVPQNGSPFGSQADD